MTKEFEDHYLNRICKYIYLQPEIAVSIDKIHIKFRMLTIDELRSKLNELDKGDFIDLQPKSSLSYTILGEDDTPIPVTDYNSASLKLKGKEVAEYGRSLYMRSLRTILLQPVVNSVISFAVGFLLAWLFKH